MISSIGNDFELHIGGLSNPHENQIYLYRKNNSFLLSCSTDGYQAAGGQNGGRFCAGGCNYNLPADFDLTYENLLEFIRNNTWVKNDIESFISKEEFEKQVEIKL